MNDETPYRLRAYQWSSNSGGGVERVFQGRHELANWLAVLLRNNDYGVKWKRLRIERFNGQKWVPAELRLQPLQIFVEGEPAVVLSWEHIVELEKMERP